MKTLSAEHLAKLRAGREKAKREGPATLRCVFCRSTGDRRPMEKHIRSCFIRSGRILPSSPPPPPIFTSGNDGRNAEEERKYRAKLGPKQLAIYYRALFEEGGHSWDAMMDEAERVLFS